MSKTSYPINPFKVGDGATLHIGSDAQAHTVTKVTRTTITLQRDKATLLNGVNSDAEDKLEFSAGGFVGHTSGTQRYDYAPDENGAVIIARLKRKPKKVWRQISEDGKHGYVEEPHFAAGGFNVTAGRREHYDFNF